MQDLISNFGFEGYGVYWSIIETLAENLNGGQEVEVRLPIKFWCNSGAISPKKFRKVCEFLSSNGNISVEFSENHVTIKSDKLSKYRDEYKRKKDKISG